MAKNDRTKGAPASRAGASKQPARGSGPLQWWPALVAVLILGAALWQLAGHLRPPSVVPSPVPSVLASEHFPSMGHQGHMRGDEQRFAHFKYNSDPPTSGYHLEAFSPTFVNSQPLPPYMQVHLLEHGNILLQYNCLCPQIANALAAIAEKFNGRLLPPGITQPSTQDVQRIEEGGLAVVVAPYPSMKHTIALTAWTRLATLDSVDESGIVSFINRWQHDTQNLTQ